MSQEPQAAEIPLFPTAGIATRLGPLAYRDFRFFWVGAMLTSIGVWVQLTSMGWLALRLTDSPFKVSLVNVFWFIPFALLALPSGVLADRLDRKAVILIPRWASAIVLFFMAYLTFSDRITFISLCALTSLVGASQIAELPARQSLTAMLVPRSQLVNALGLTSTFSNMSRMLGPILAGALTKWVGEGGGFSSFGIFQILGGISLFFIATSGVITGLNRQAQATNVMREMVEGLRYLYRHKDAYGLVLVAVLTGSLGWVYLALLPVVAKNVLHGDAVTVGTLGMAIGSGGMIAALFLAFYQGPSRQGQTMVIALLIWGVALVMFAYSRWYAISLPLLVLVGFAYGLHFTLNNALILRVVNPGFHGRVISVQNLNWGANIIGTLAAGAIAQTFGVSLAVGLSGVLIIFATLGVLAYRPAIWRL